MFKASTTRVVRPHRCYSSVIQRILSNELPHSDIQKRVFAADGSKRHTIIKAPVGSGKTISYLLPAIRIIRKAMSDQMETQRPGFRGLIIANNLERALEISQSVKELAEHYDEPSLTVRSITGGRSLQREIDFIDRVEPEVVVATLGRLSEHINNSDYFRNLQVLVIDEAQNYEKTESNEKLNTILSQLNKDRRTFVVGDEGLKNVPEEWLGDIPTSVQTVQSNVSKPVDAIKHDVIQGNDFKDVFEKVASLIQNYYDKKAIVFVPNSSVAKFLFSHLGENDIYTTMIASQRAMSRYGAYATFKGASSGVLLANRNNEDSVPGDVDIVINVGQPTKESENKRLSKLKNEETSRNICIQFKPFDEAPAKKVTMPNINKISLKVGLMSKPLLKDLYENVIAHSISTGASPKDAINQGKQICTDYGVEVPKTRLYYANKLGITKELSRLDLIAPQINEQEEKDLSDRVDNRAKAIKDILARKRRNKDKKNAEDQRKKLRQIQEETEKLSQIKFE